MAILARISSFHRLIQAETEAKKKTEKAARSPALCQIHTDFHFLSEACKSTSSNYKWMKVY
jgi:hypothetical protein